VNFDHFTRVAEAAFEAIPEEYRQGIDGLVVSRDAEAHPERPDVWTLGVCETESYPSEWVGPETTRSVVRLFFGSFVELARQDPDFDWMAEIHETVEHEVRHHLEWLAGGDELGDVDEAMDETFKRFEGLEWDPWFFQKGDRVAEGVFAVEDQVFIEVELTPAAFDRLETVTFAWRDQLWCFTRPAALGDLHFVRVDGLEGAPGRVEVVLVRRRRWWDWVRAAARSGPHEVLESEAVARPVVSPPPGPVLP
jgi:hypothetical protein